MHAACGKRRIPLGWKDNFCSSDHGTTVFIGVNLVVVCMTQFKCARSPVTAPVPKAQKNKEEEEAPRSVIQTDLQSKHLEERPHCATAPESRMNTHVTACVLAEGFLFIDGFSCPKRSCFPYDGVHF
eukprot:945683-Amphidinium_carterae.1